MDAIAPRTRASRSQRPESGRVVLTPREITWFQKLNAHGPLPTRFLYRFTQEQTPSEHYVHTRLRALWGTRAKDSDSRSDGYLWRPGRAFFKVGPNDNEVYANTRFADEHLFAEGLTTHRSIVLNNKTYHHELFSASITASIELSCRADPSLDYLGEHQLIDRAPARSRHMPCQIEHTYERWDKENMRREAVRQTDDTPLIPDKYFAVRKTAGTAGSCAFFLEADCGSESQWRNTLTDKSWLATLLKYRHIFRDGKYKQHFGIPWNALVLIVTTKHSQAEGIKRVLHKITDGRGTPYVCIKTWHEFDDELFVPPAPNETLLSEPWERVGHKPLFIA